MLSPLLSALLQIALQAALAKAQLAETAHRISERNAVEIVLKLIELKKVQVRQKRAMRRRAEWSCSELGLTRGDSRAVVCFCLS